MRRALLVIGATVTVCLAALAWLSMASPVPSELDIALGACRQAQALTAGEVRMCHPQNQTLALTEQ